MEAQGGVLAATWLSLSISATAVVIAAIPAVPLGVGLGLTRSKMRGPLVLAARVGMSFPTVLIGLVVYGMLTRHGPLGGLDLLYTPQAIVIGEVMLAAPMIVALVETAASSLDPRFRETTRAMGMSRAARLATTGSSRGTAGSRLQLKTTATSSATAHATATMTTTRFMNPSTERLIPTHGNECRVV